MKLKHITFTGIDAQTDLKRLEAIQKSYPIAEFGVLTSYHWYENGNRFLDPRMFRRLTTWSNLHLSLHLCGRVAHDAVRGDWSGLNYLSWGEYRWFRRIQLNVSSWKDNPEIASTTPYGNEVILQQKGIDHLNMFCETRKSWPSWCPEKLSVLIDASGGQGIDADIKVFPNANKAFKVGYAGGINPDNVEEKLTFLMNHPDVGDFWIDMESGVRTNDWFDLDKVEHVLQICQRVIGQPPTNEFVGLKQTDAFAKAQTDQPK